MNTLLGFVLVAAFLNTFVFSEEDELFNSAVLEANEFLDGILENKILESPTKLGVLEDFSCHIQKNLLFGVIPTHRDIVATFWNGTLGGPLRMSNRKCLPIKHHHEGHNSLTCTLSLEINQVWYSSAVTGFNLRGSTSQGVINATAIAWIALNLIQKPPAPPILNNLSVRPTADSLQIGEFGFNRARQYNLFECVDSELTWAVKLGVDSYLTRVISEAIRDKHLPVPRLGDSKMPPNLLSESVS